MKMKEMRRTDGMLRRECADLVIGIACLLLTGCGQVTWPVTRADGQHRVCLSYGSYQGDPAAGGRLHNAGDGWSYAPPVPYEPTKDSPIILKKGELIFGGKDGRRRDTIDWQIPVIAMTVSPGGQRAAVVTASQGTPTSVRVYDPDRTLLSETKLTEKPFSAKIWCADDAFVVVSLRSRLEEMQRRAMTLRAPQEAADKLPPPPFPAFVVRPSGKAQGIKLPGVLVDVSMLGQRTWVAGVPLPAQKEYALSLYKDREVRWTKSLPLPADAVRGYSILSTRGDVIEVLSHNYSRLVFGLDGTLIRETRPKAQERQP